MGTDAIRVKRELLEQRAVSVLKAVKVPEPEAVNTAKVLLFADQRGIESHGISKLPIYIKRILDGGVNPKAIPEVIGAKGAVTNVDAHNAVGPVGGIFGMDRAIEAAEKYGIGITTVRNSNHFGVTAFYSMMALFRGMIGVALSNANPTVAPWGGKRAMVGTSPLSIAIPSGKGIPFVLDMATTTVARGKIHLYARDRKPLPPGWALDQEGRETTDPEVALKGLLTPLGGAKGSGLALAIDILTGVLSSAKYLTDVGHLYTETNQPQGIGHLFLALEIEAFLPLRDFLSEMDQYIEQIHGCPRARTEDPIYIPGELEFAAMERSEKDGVLVSQATVEELRSTAIAVGLKSDLFTFG